MKPKKVVLCVDADPDQLSLRSFLLETWGFRVLRAASMREAMAHLRREGVGSVRVLLVERTGLEMMGKRLVDSAREFDRDLGTLLTSRVPLGVGVDHGADVYLPRVCSAAVLVEQIKILAARSKRTGPKPVVGIPAVRRVGVAVA